LGFFPLVCANHNAGIFAGDPNLENRNLTQTFCLPTKTLLQPLPSTRSPHKQEHTHVFSTARSIMLGCASAVAPAAVSTPTTTRRTTRRTITSAVVITNKHKKGAYVAAVHNNENRRKGVVTFAAADESNASDSSSSSSSDSAAAAASSAAAAAASLDKLLEETNSAFENAVVTKATSEFDTAVQGIAAGGLAAALSAVDERLETAMKGEAGGGGGGGDGGVGNSSTHVMFAVKTPIDDSRYY
jgi:hypothetical protein